MVDDMFDLGPESRDAVRRRMHETESLIARYGAERDELTAVTPDGLSPEDAANIEQLAAKLEEMHDALVDAGPGELRQIAEYLDVRGTVQTAPPDDPEAVRFGQKHRFRVDWTTRIHLSDNGTRF